MQLWLLFTQPQIKFYLVYRLAKLTLNCEERHNLKVRNKSCLNQLSMSLKSVNLCIDVRFESNSLSRRNILLRNKILLATKKHTLAY